MGIWLVMQSADGIERSFPLRKPRTVIGREAVCDVRVAMPAVSDKHCEIVVEEGRLRLSDLDSARGTLHNGSKVREAVLSHQDTLTVGPVTFVVRFAEDQANGSSEITIHRTDPLPTNGELPLNGLDHAHLESTDDHISDD